jgi:hypothetical protein
VGEDGGIELLDGVKGAGGDVVEAGDDFWDGFEGRDGATGVDALEDRKLVDVSCASRYRGVLPLGSCQL